MRASAERVRPRDGRYSPLRRSAPLSRDDARGVISTRPPHPSRYVDVCATTAARRAKLLAQYAFECACARCCPPPPAPPLAAPAELAASAAAAAAAAFRLPAGLEERLEGGVDGRALPPEAYARDAELACARAWLDEAAAVAMAVGDEDEGEGEGTAREGEGWNEASAAARELALLRRALDVYQRRLDPLNLEARHATAL